jgi:hypothetical protein
MGLFPFFSPKSSRASGAMGISTDIFFIIAAAKNAFVV